MTDYRELVKALRSASTVSTAWEKLMHDAAAAIEELQALYRQMDKRNTDLHNEGYDVGYWAGKRDAEAAQPHWVSVEERLPKETKLVVTYGKSRVSFGYNLLLYDADTDKEVVEWFDYCGNRGNVTHWMPLPEPPQEVQDGPIITPCRGCSDYDGYGGCKSKGGCARAKMEVQGGQ